MKIFHIPSGYPVGKYKKSGISVRDFIYAFSDTYPNVQNIVSIFHATVYDFSFGNKAILKEIRSYLSSDSGIRSELIKPNLRYCYSKRTIIYSNKLGFDFASRFLQRHRENLQYAIDNNEKPDILHGQFTIFGGWVAWKLSKEFDIPFVITERFGPFPPPGILQNEQLPDDYYLPMMEAGILVSVSHSHASDINKYIRKDVRVIHNIINEELFKPLFSSRPSGNKFVFLTITSSYQPNKGISLLLKAIYLLKKKGIVAEYIIGGGGRDQYLIDLLKEAKELNIETEIKWVEQLDREEVAEQMQLADCIVSTSYYESFGLVCAEAVACGKPVIATKSGGPESIISEINGLLVEKGNSEALAIAMEKMMNNAGNYQSQTIRKDFLERFSKKTIMSQYFDIYYNLLKNR